MSVETLDHAIKAAADRIHLDLHELNEATRPEVIYLGTLSTANGELEVPAWRAYSGSDDLVGKGGIRMTDELGIDNYETETPEIAGELAREMFGKIGLFALDGYRGAKGLIGVNPNTISFEDRGELMTQYSERMVEMGLAGADNDIPAGDMGTNGLSDYYAKRYFELTGDPNWQASITGKSVELGGLELRPHATGLGVDTALEYEIARLRTSGIAPEHYVHSVKLQGFGNVGSHLGYYVGQNFNTTRLTGISDKDGTLAVNGEYQGMIITEEIIRTIGDNPMFRGDKLQILKEMLERNQPSLNLKITDNPQDIYSLGTDWFIPAAAPDVINHETAAQLAYTTKYGIIEAGNGVTTAMAHYYLLKHGKIIVPDIAANGGGIQGSIIEINENLAQVESPGQHEAISNQATYDQLVAASTKVMDKLHNVAENLGTDDLRIAAAAIFETQLSQWQGVDVDDPNTPM